jgi:hypothetical protein
MGLLWGVQAIDLNSKSTFRPMKSGLSGEVPNCGCPKSWWRESRPFQIQLFTGKSYVQSEPHISIVPARAWAISGDRANNDNPKECFAISVGSLGSRKVGDMGATLSAALRLHFSLRT